MSAQLERLQIIEQLRKLASEQNTGTFFIKTPSQHLAVFVFEKGKIISLTYSHFRGSKALPEIARINSGECSYKASVSGRPQADIPTTREIIHLLESNTSGISKTIPTIDNKAQNATQTSVESDNNNITQLPAFSEEELLSGIASILLDHIGPIAAMICDDAASDMGGISSHSGALSLIQNLSSDIGESHQQKKFISDAGIFIKKFFR